MRLTKSEFMQGRACHQRVVHHRDGMPSQRDDDAMTRELVINEQIIHYLYQKHRRGSLTGATLEQLIAGAPQKSFDVDLHANGFEARADMINVTGREIVLLEVKAAAYPTDQQGRLISPITSAGEVDSAFAELIADITYQALIFEEMLTSMQIQRAIPFKLRYEFVLMHPYRTTATQLLRQTFEADHGVVRHAEDWKSRQLLQTFARFDVTDVVRIMMPIIDSERREMLRRLEQQEPPMLSSKCKSCEYRTTIYSEEPNGFMRCWREKAFKFPHLLDVPNIHNVMIDEEDAVSVLARQGKAIPVDLPAHALKPDYNNLQERVVRAFAADVEQQEPELRGILGGCAAPHAFINVEAFSGPLSLWEDGRPYQLTAFQWSCHILDGNGAMHHHEWLHEASEHPAVAFLTSLHDVLKSAGTIYTWSSYERTTVAHALKAVPNRHQERYQELDPEVLAWAKSFIVSDNPTVVDMHELAQRYYVHPEARGSYSIRKVLDAIWKQHHQRFMPQFAQYYEKLDGYISSPYETLPVNYESSRLATIRDSAQAMIAYYDMLHGTGRRKPHVRDNLRHALLEYSKLDSAAMMIIYQHWMGR